ncbi:hypothetical protein B5M42_013365 [Paenibacillus athensensis]|uniref:Uncharacterized protein n=1 Tax=Paenibacillus athensensis TaxID=1967502 RepID=A0A4Y8Q657_9BACL|nr:hypothetical protein [Paenibacillus athensensis]MCD1259823.1 hypothetical protein [Paenibacillus athensensis]
MDQWIAFAQDRWYLIVAAVIVLFVIVGIVKTFVKWVLIIIVVGCLVLYGANYKDKLQSVGASVASQVGQEVKDSAIKALAGEAKEAKFKANPDGSYEVTTKSLKVSGNNGSDEVEVTFMGKSFTMNANAAVKAFIDQAKKNSQ